MSNYLYYDYAKSCVCKVKEDGIEKNEASSIHSYLNQKCLEKGSDINGRKHSFSYLTKQKKFIPVYISSTEIYFPITSISNPEVIYINYFEIKSIETKEKTCIIYFKDNTCFTCQNPKRIQSIVSHIQRYLLMI
ncbi:competence protein ComK [Floccifex sp.]|uniref:competence protein ComK n=1 Tax=Floccifex sp. TaxID=2815810 RepID=UPI003F0ED92F